MKTEVSVAQLLQWRLACAEEKAPPPPRAARLLEMARPWWERYPERLQFFIERVARIQIGRGPTVAEGSFCTPHLVAALVVRGEEPVEALVRVLDLSVRDGQFHFRFQLGIPADPGDRSFEVTFIANSPARPVVCAKAGLVVENEYRLDAELAPDITREWEQLKETDQMPFRLILRPVMDGLEHS